MHVIDPNPWRMLKGYEPFSLCDWPGRISAALFFGGCNLRCPTCHNASFAWHPEIFPVLEYHGVLEQVQRNRNWLEGLVVTGGEVTFLPGFDSLLHDLSRLNIPVKLDTNGLRPDCVKLALEHGSIKMIAVDIKGPWHMYPGLTGNRAGSAQARECLGQILALAADHPGRFMFRTTRVPGLSKSDIEDVKACLPPGFELKVQHYRPAKITSNQ
ncbi:radical SAM protein [Desulfonatronospira sp.]|uniref:radical SAM protein n=1 Tax=Desulfonatronospira sp. TaxID=1962951 RepID=UPI0025BBCD03|nr:radical SAM protein [Desulfonatronospira sp.]